MCILPTVLCQGMKEGLHFFAVCYIGAAHDIPITSFYDHIIVW